MILNLPEGDAGREDKCGKFRSIIGLRSVGFGKISNSTLKARPSLEICPLSPPPIEPKFSNNMKKIRRNVKEEI